MPTPAFARGRHYVGMTIPLPPEGHRKGRLLLLGIVAWALFQVVEAEFG
jgi:hypothetical protein